MIEIQSRSINTQFESTPLQKEEIESPETWPVQMRMVLTLEKCKSEMEQDLCQEE